MSGQWNYAAARPASFGAIEPQQRRGRRRKRSTGARLLTTLLVLAGLAVGADRLALWATQRTIEQALSANVAQAGHSGAEVDLTGTNLRIHGFPFLTQLFSGRLQHISGNIVHGQMGQLEVRDLKFSAYGVQIPVPTFADFTQRLAGQPTQIPLQVDQLEVNAVFPFTTVAAALNNATGAFPGGITVSPASGNALQLSTELLGLQLGFVAEPSVLPPQTINVHVTQVYVGGLAVTPSEIPFGLGDQIPTDFQFNAALPAGTTIESVQVQRDGLRVTASVHNADLAQFLAQ